jgi:putative transposase
MAELCGEFDVSRKTGDKIVERYKECGLDGLTDRNRRPYRQANKLPVQIERLILRLKQEYPSFGAPKILEKLERKHPDLKLPAISTVHAVLDRHGLVTERRQRRYNAERHPAVEADPPERAVVRRLQGSVHAGRPSLSLSAHGHRFQQPLSLRSPRRDCLKAAR